VIVGTAGHIDHGKTALVRALTGTDTDRLKEEKARGITIDLGFAYMPGEAGAVIGFVDVPGHERLVRNMLAGAGGIDLALIVVAADDGVMPQTREHLAILDLLGISRGLVALTKADLADADRLAAARAGIANALLGTALEDAEILPVSSVTGAGVDALRARLLAAARATSARPAGAPFRLAVDRSFTLPGAGTVVTGTVIAGSVRPGHQLVASPSGRPVRVRGLHAQNRAAGIATTGERCALNLAGEGVTPETVRRGDMVLDPWLHAPADRIDARLRVLPEGRPVTQWLPVHLHHGSAELTARVALLADGPIAPGGEGLVQLVLDRPIAAQAGDRFVIRDPGARHTLGGGAFLDLRAPARRRRSPGRLAQLAAHALPDPEAALAALLSGPPWQLDPDAFARDRGLSPADFAAMAGRASLVRIEGRSGAVALSAAGAERLERAILATLAAFHDENPDLAGIGSERLRGGLDPRLPAPAFVAHLRTLARDGKVSLDGSWVRLPGHEVRLAEGDEILWEEMQPMLGGEARFRPPRVRDLAGLLDLPEADVRRLCLLLARMGRLHEVAHDHFFLRDTVGEMAAIAAELDAAHGLFGAAEFRDRLDNGRKVAIQILEFLDRHGVTLRRGDLRRINPRRLDLFPRDLPGGPVPGPSPDRGDRIVQSA
jgi:selenocysteine-specific elongation factor